MTRRLLIPAAGFALIVVLVAGGLGWVTVASLRVEQAQREATARAARLNQERLALWRLDGHMLPVLALEGSRPFAHYAAPAADQPPSPLLSAELPDWMLLHFHLDSEAGWRSPQVMPAEVAAQLRANSPSVALGNVTPDRDRRLAELTAKFPPAAVVPGLGDAGLSADDPAARPSADGPGKEIPRLEGMFRSPAAPAVVPPPMPGPAGAANAPAEAQQAAAAHPQSPNPATDARGEQSYRYQLSQRILNSSNGIEVPADNGKANRDKQAVHDSEPDVALKAKDAVTAFGGSLPFGPVAAGAPMPPTRPVAPAAVADARRQTELRFDKKSADRATAERKGMAGGFGGGAGPPAAAMKAEAEQLVAAAPHAVHEMAKALEPPAVRLGPLVPRWLVAADGTELLVLVRAARPGQQTVYQGVVLDWPKLQRTLAGQVADLFPAAQVVPVRATDAPPPEQTMTALPARLDPGPDPPLPPAGWTPLRVGLALAWAAALVALAAVGAGGAALVGLSERRIRFVSAVTHELRTPLTSLRLYLDLLASGMVTDEAKQKEYIVTLAAESDRLHRLVENVLDFARLEKRAVQAHAKTIPVADLLAEVRATWADRLAADGKELVVVSTLPDGKSVTTDPRVAAQVVGNLVDNARKYSRDAADGRVWVWAKPGDRGRVAFEVEDRGPGVPACDRRGLFRPFTRGSAGDTPAGGAGLGLALAKQWAGVLGGKLTYRPADGGVGACFRLELPGV